MQQQVLGQDICPAILLCNRGQRLPREVWFTTSPFEPVTLMVTVADALAALDL